MDYLLIHVPLVWLQTQILWGCSFSKGNTYTAVFSTDKNTLVLYKEIKKNLLNLTSLLSYGWPFQAWKRPECLSVQLEMAVMHDVLWMPGKVEQAGWLGT